MHIINVYVECMPNNRGNAELKAQVAFFNTQVISTLWYTDCGFLLSEPITNNWKEFLAVIMLITFSSSSTPNKGTLCCTHSMFVCAC